MLALGVQPTNRLSLIPGWAGFAAPKPELGVEHIEGPDGAPLFFVAGRVTSLVDVLAPTYWRRIARVTWLCCNTLGLRIPSQIWNPARHS
jgi:hypothetical protein